MAQTSGFLYSFPQITVSENDIEDINNLLGQLSKSPRRLTAEQLSAILRQTNFVLWIVRDKNKRVVAMASLIIYETLLKKVGVIEDVVVDAEHRGKGLAKQAMRVLITFAKVKEFNRIELTSNPAREVANRLYLSLGFKKRDTNCYRLDL